MIEFMNKNSILDRFIVFEQNHKLFNRFYHDFNYWCYIRFEIYNEIYRNINKTSPISLNIKKKTILKVIEKLNKIRDISESFIKYPRKKKDIIIMQHPRKLLIDDYYQDIYTNYLAEKYCDNSIIIDCRLTSSYYHKQKYKYYKDDITTIWRYYYKIITPNDKKEDLFLKSLQINIEKEFKINLPQNYLSQLIYERFLIYKSYHKYYTQLLKRTSPKCIIEVVYYGANNMVLNEIAKEMHIPTIELQHGTMGYNHIAYNLPSQIYLKQLPSHMFLFSDYWQKTSRIPQQTHIKITGYPYFEEQYNKTFNTYQKANISNRKKNILFISQTTIGLDLSKFASQLVELIDLNQYNIQYKFHPAEYDQWKERMPWLYEKRHLIEIIENKNKTLYQLFASSDIQIGVYSTGIYEGLGFNLRTYIVALPGWEGMAPLIENNYAQLIQKPEELIEAIESMNISQNKSSNPTFWKMNSKNNIFSEIETILNSYPPKDQ